MIKAKESLYLDEARGEINENPHCYQNKPFLLSVPLNGNDTNKVSGANNGLSLGLQESLSQLARLIANVTEAYTAAIFTIDSSNESNQPVLNIAAAQTLSRDFLPNSVIGFGCGLVGWTAENGVRISVCPFENDSTTLLYYSKDQDLKSFIAVPILDSENKVMGVVSCDSKKSYAFAKVTEKILLDCAAQASILISLHKNIVTNSKVQTIADDRITSFIENIREQKHEQGLLKLVAELPIDLVDRDALVVITTEDEVSGAAAFYSSKNQLHVGHRLLELVCKHKKILCRERSVHALPIDESSQRSFLSIPFQILNREAGSINLLSKPFEAFSAVEISALERIAGVLGRELELLRLREKLVSTPESIGLVSWKSFRNQAQSIFEQSKRKQLPAFSLIRVTFSNLAEIEDYAGIDLTSSILVKVLRLVEQAKRSTAPACCVYGSHILILTETSEAERTVGRLQAMIKRSQWTETQSDLRQNKLAKPSMSGHMSVKFDELVRNGIVTAVTHFPKDGDSLEQLCAKTLRHIDLSKSSTTLEVLPHASNW